MSYTYPVHAYPTSVTTTRTTTAYIPSAALVMGSVGAIVGASGAAAKNIRQVKKGKVSNQEAAKDVLKEAAGAGIATAAATAVVSSFGSRGVLSLLGVLAVATTTKYFWDAATESEKK